MVKRAIYPLYLWLSFTLSWSNPANSDVDVYQSFHVIQPRKWYVYPTILWNILRDIHGIWPTTWDDKVDAAVQKCVFLASLIGKWWSSTGFSGTIFSTNPPGFPWRVNSIHWQFLVPVNHDPGREWEGWIELRKTSTKLRTTCPEKSTSSFSEITNNKSTVGSQTPGSFG